MMIVLDNIVFSLQKIGGISVYWFELIQRLVQTNNKIFFIHRTNSNILGNKLNNTIITSNSSKVPLFLDRFFAVKTEFLKSKFIFHSSYNRFTRNPNAISVITLHDFIHEKYYSGIRKMIHVYQKKKAIKNSKAIIVISDNTKKDLLYYYPELCKKKIIKKIYNGVSSEFFSLKNNTSFENTFLFVGSREMYKNFEFSIISISKLKNYSITIVGRPLNKSEIYLLNTYLKGRWITYINISNVLLNKLYNNSFALVYPSSYEGFGIPLLESMKSGCPFIALNSSSIPEVAGDAGFLMDELIFDNFKKGVRYIEANRDFIIQKGFLQAKKFSWDQCYKQTLDLYKELYK